MSPMIWCRHDDYRFLEAGPAHGPPVLLLHGMLGGPGNWAAICGPLIEAGYRVVAPELPVYDLPLDASTVGALVDFTVGFAESIVGRPLVVGGNSLGGHVGALFAADHPERVSALMLSGSSGLYELDLGTTVLRRRDRGFIRERAALTFHDSRFVTDDLVEEVYGIVNDRNRALRLIRMARSVQAGTLSGRLESIRCPALLVWGQDDRLTPPFVGEEFHAGLPTSELHLLPDCGHAPMIEHPEAFSGLFLDFLARLPGFSTRAA